MKRLLQFLIFAPLAVFLVALSVANRAPVTLSFDPFSATDPAISFSIPLFWLLFATLIAGVFIGGCVVWVKQGRFRKEARDQKFEAAKARHEAKEAKAAMPSEISDVSNLLPARKAS